jgi:hypothetical protein
MEQLGSHCTDSDEILYLCFFSKSDNMKMDLRESGMGEHGLDQSGSGQGQVASFCECGNERLGSIKCRIFF